MGNAKTGKASTLLHTQIHVAGTHDVWTLIPETPGFIFINGEEEPEEVVLIDAQNMRIYAGPECSWHSFGHALECVEKISREGCTFDRVAVKTGPGKYLYRE
jgi:hypothetical protein